jgi:hypothetical protein
MTRKIGLRLVFVALVFAGGYGAGWFAPARAQALDPSPEASRTATAPLPKAWGSVRAALGRDEITLILEDDQGTIRAVTLDRSISRQGAPAVTPRVFAVLTRE